MKLLENRRPLPVLRDAHKVYQSGNASLADRYPGTLGSACATLKERRLFWRKEQAAADRHDVIGKSFSKSKRRTVW